MAKASSFSIVEWHEACESWCCDVYRATDEHREPRSLLVRELAMEVAEKLYGTPKEKFVYQETNWVMVANQKSGKCFRCDASIVKKQLFCSDHCKQYSAVVRRTRTLIGRAEAENHLLEALGSQVLWTRGNCAYPKSRLLSQVTRKLVYDKFDGRCAHCGTLGAQIDHVYGGSNELENLQLLCENCHRVKTNNSLKPLDESGIAEMRIHLDRLADDVLSYFPRLLCFDQNRWSVLWRNLRSIRSENSRK